MYIDGIYRSLWYFVHWTCYIFFKWAKRIKRNRWKKWDEKKKKKLMVAAYRRTFWTCSLAFAAAAVVGNRGSWDCWSVKLEVSSRDWCRVPMRCCGGWWRARRARCEGYGSDDLGTVNVGTCCRQRQWGRTGSRNCDGRRRTSPDRASLALADCSDSPVAAVAARCWSPGSHCCLTDYYLRVAWLGRLLSCRCCRCVAGGEAREPRDDDPASPKVSRRRNCRTRAHPGGAWTHPWLRHAPPPPGTRCSRCCRGWACCCCCCWSSCCSCRSSCWRWCSRLCCRGSRPSAASEGKKTGGDRWPRDSPDFHCSEAAKTPGDFGACPHRHCPRSYSSHRTTTA